MDALKKAKDAMAEDELKRREKEARRNGNAAWTAGSPLASPRVVCCVTWFLSFGFQVQTMTDAAVKDVDALTAEKTKDIKGGS